MSDLKIFDFIKEVGENAEAHGFHEVTGSPLEYLAQIHCEVSEVVEELRNGRELTETYHSDEGKPEGVPSELADVVLRCFDFAYGRGTGETCPALPSRGLLALQYRMMMPRRHQPHSAAWAARNAQGHQSW